MLHPTLSCALCLASVLFFFCIAAVPFLLPTFYFPTETTSTKDNSSFFPSDSARFLTPAEQTHTRAFLRCLAAAIPDLQPRWPEDRDFCAWDAVHCSERGVVVSFENFSITTANSSLPDLPADLDGGSVAVTRFYLYHQGPRLRGTLPPSWGRLRRLESLFLIDNGLSGTLPAEWGTAGEMTALTSLMLSLNNFTGTLPESWRSLRYLQTVVVAGNALTGPLPPAWGDMPVLFRADVSGNALCGCVPREWKRNRVLDVIADAAVTAANCSTANPCVLLQ